MVSIQIVRRDQQWQPLRARKGPLVGDEEAKLLG
jgi:hypothetical protein